ncbi:hypothetical protein Sango_1868600 [Sesamum angolense]|uniref:RNase H type-1 domain-containing protein n=1 Tax=Sesamum angolense TaxID=2727404 RepID=A0AAE2BQL2_9LAMI|nr:hypothetical protein Sango_1868600 [Sesamum angolense]
MWQHFAALFGFRLCDTGNLTHMWNAAKYHGVSFSIDGIILESTPSPSWFKLNTNGSSLGNPGLAGAAGIFRDSDEHVHLTYHVALGTETSVIAELTAVWWVLSLPRHTIQQMLVSDFRHTFREVNGVADHLAKETVSLQLTRMLCHDDITGVLRDILSLDRRGVPHLRWGR